MTARERFVACLTFKPADRCFVKSDGIMPLTMKRWIREGLPEGCEPSAYLGMDAREYVRVNMECCPGFEEKLISRDGEYVVKTNSEGITLKQREDDALSAMPQFLGWPVETRDDFERTKEQFQPSVAQRYPADYEQKLDFWNNRSTDPVGYEFRGAFFHRLRMWMGLEGLCMAMCEDPEWVHEMVAFLEEFLVAVSEKVLSEVKLDFVYMCDDIAYKTASLISPAHFREFFLEPTRRMVERVRRAGVPVIIMDTDGNLDEFASIYLDAGFNVLTPVEVAAGNDVIELRKRFGRKLALQGGFDKRALAAGREAIHAEVMRIYPRMMAEGGFVPGVDHQVPEDVSWDSYRYYVDVTRQVAEDPHRWL
ncbi:MAG: hypothetical protein A2Z18_09370 [Armatimonadetes bacterium RBG_16_58_9]|nr:MAG: hypothetical protein A2Z18_09370 [Armatimonadetes bacterium RBG_16_58_9]